MESLLVEVAGVILRGALDVGLVLKQLLDAQEDLLDGDHRFPIFLLIQY